MLVAMMAALKVDCLVELMVEWWVAPMVGNLAAHLVVQ